MAALRIFSYLPNPRIWKATIAGRLAGLEIEVRGAPTHEVKDWRWDFDARPLTAADREADGLRRAGRTGFAGTLYKTDAFLKAHPFGTVPAAFSPDGKQGIFESNSIMRAVGRLAAPALGLYGSDAYSAARIDSFLDASLVFARDGQLYLFALRDDKLDSMVHQSAAAAFSLYLSGIEAALSPDRDVITGEVITLADICFVAEMCLFANERLFASALERAGLPLIWSPELANKYPRSIRHFERLAVHPAFAPDVSPYLRKLDLNQKA